MASAPITIHQSPTVPSRQSPIPNHLLWLTCASVLLCAALAPASAQGQAPNGKAIFDGKCVECHGAAGKGDGPAAAFLTPRPRDFTTGKYKIRTTESGSVPSDADLVQSVRQGLYGSAMPAWDRILSDEDIRGVVDYIKSLSPQFAAPPK